MTKSFYCEIYNLGYDTLTLNHNTNTIQVIAPNGTSKTNKGSFSFAVYFIVLVNGVEVKSFKNLANTEKFLNKLMA